MIAGFLVLLGLLAPSEENPLDQGYRAMYNLDFAGAHKAFAEYQREQPNDPFGPASDAAAYLFSEFDRLKVLRSEFFTNDKNFLEAKKLQSDPKIKASFEAAIRKSRALSDEMLKRDSGRDEHNSQTSFVRRCARTTWP